MSPTNDKTAGYQIMLQPIQVQETAAAELVCGGIVSTFRLWVQRGWMPAGTKLGKYRYWLVKDLIQAVENLHRPRLTEAPQKSPYAKAQRETRRIARARR